MPAPEGEGLCLSLVKERNCFMSATTKYETQRDFLLRLLLWAVTERILRKRNFAVTGMVGDQHSGDDTIAIADHCLWCFPVVNFV